MKTAYLPFALLVRSAFGVFGVFGVLGVLGPGLAQSPGAAGLCLPSPKVSFAVLPVAASTKSDPVAFARAAGELAARVHRVEWTVESRAAALATGIEPAFAYVRDAIGYEPYPGVLRGASGTYTARAGNAVDRALLLARLLELKNIRTRFAFGTLGASVCERLWQHAFDRVPLAPGLGDRAVSEGAMRQRIAARASRDYAAVRTALGDRLPPVIAPARNLVLAEMEPHVWLQAAVDDQWIDLDPSLPDAVPGAPLTTVARTAVELPAELYQSVTIRVVAEQLLDGVLTNDTLLEVTRKAVELVDEQVFVVHTPGRPGAMAVPGARGDAEHRQLNCAVSAWIAVSCSTSSASLSPTRSRASARSAAVCCISSWTIALSNGSACLYPARRDRTHEVGILLPPARRRQGARTLRRRGVPIRGEAAQALEAQRRLQSAPCAQFAQGSIEHLLVVNNTMHSRSLLLFLSLASLSSPAAAQNPGLDTTWDTAGMGVSDSYGVNAGGQVTPISACWTAAVSPPTRCSSRTSPSC